MRTPSSMILPLALPLSCLVFTGTGCPDRGTNEEKKADAKVHLSKEEKHKADEEAQAGESPSPTNEGPKMDPEPDEDTGSVPETDDLPCTSNVKKKEEGAKITYELMCSGTCGGDHKCESRKASDPHGATRQWCGCTDIEPAEGCGMVITTDTKGKAEAICPPRDCGGDPCAIKETGTLTGGGMKLTTLTCSCPG